MTQRPRPDDAVLGGHSPAPQPGIIARLRIEGNSAADLDAIIAAIAQNLEILEQSRDYPNRGGSGIRRYLEVRSRG